MKLLPVALNVAGASVLVVGGGKVAARKSASLLECGALVTVISPTLCDELQVMKSQFEFHARAFQSNNCENHTLVFACTNDAQVNAQIAAEAKSKNIWVQVADDAGGSTLHGAAVVRRDEICIGITTGGASPALAKFLKEEIENCVGHEYSHLLQLMGARRDEIKQMISSQTERADFWRQLLAKEVLPLLRDGRKKDATDLIEELLKTQNAKLKIQNYK